MSADNWTTCPKCDALAEAAYAKKRQIAEAKYGKIPAADYLAAIKDLDANPLKRNETWREDYSIGVNGREFSVNYSGGCRVCGLKFEYVYDATVPLDGGA
jgi:hypothetical protein